MSGSDPKAAGRYQQLARRRSRCGMLTIWVLVSLIVVASLLASATLQQLRLRQQHRQWIDQRQRCWLIWSALERVTIRLAKEPDYRGEQWIPAASRTPSAEIPTVQVTLAPQDQHWRVRVTVQSRATRSNNMPPEQYVTEFLLAKVAGSH